MKILKMKQFWVAVIAAAAVASGVIYSASNSRKAPFSY